MLKGKILGIPVEIEQLTNPEVARKYEDSIDTILERMRSAQDCERGSDGVRMQCQAIIDTFTEMFGEEKAREILGEQTTLFRCLDAFDEYVNLYPRQVTPALEKRAEKFSRSRLDGR